MSIHEDLTTLLGSVAGGNFYLQAYPQEMELPCVVFRVVSKDPIQTICGPTGEYQYEMAFECWASSFSEADTISQDVKTILNSDISIVKYESSSPGEDYEPVTDDFMQPLYFTFFYQE